MYIIGVIDISDGIALVKKEQGTLFNDF